MRQDPNMPVTADLLSLTHLLTQYMSRQAAVAEEGGELAELGEVVPHDLGAVQPIDPRLAWEEAIVALRQGTGWKDPLALRVFPTEALQEWKTLVTSQEPALMLSFCTGNFPQMVRNLQALLQASKGDGSPVADAAARVRPVPVPALIEWAEEASEKAFPYPILAVGVLRLAQEYDRAAAILRSRSDVPEQWQAAWTNEEAALAWQSGRQHEAADLWQTRGDGSHVPTLFNRGMAALFLGRPAEARAALTEAAKQLPEDSSWHHLARLYLALAEIRA